MENAFFHRLSNILWGVMVILIVLLAIYVSLGRMLTANLGAYQGPILQVLNSRVPFTIGAQRVSGEWQSFTPVIVLSGLQLSAPGSAESPLELAEGRIAVDVLNSLRTRSLQMTRVALDGLRLRGELGAQGKFRLSGLDGGGGQITQWLEEFLLNVELVALHNNVLKLTMPDGEQRELDLELLLSRDGSYRHVEAQLISTAGTDITILAEGVGNPFAPELFNGDLYLDIQSSDLGAVKHMLGSGLPPVWADGSLQLELWLAWSKGKPALEARLEAHDLVIGAQDEAWQVPLDRVGLEARLVQRRNHWTVFASGLEVEQDDVLLQLPRLQFDVWGDALRVRLPDVSLAPINAIASNLDAMPEALADVLHTLQPRGQLSALQLSIGDLNDLAGDWEVEANFEALAVESWKGAPGVSSASGYAQVTSRGGFVVLDSQNLTMDFPMIYRQVLHYDDFYGTININWDEQAVNLSSGLITTQGDEGTVHALFGLDIPLVPNDIGIEMDLLVGFADAHPLHRVKYVPYLLDESLIDWLTTSIQEGRIDQGAFLWRGSVKRNSAPLHTIQLAFNITDTDLEFHPQWPPVTVHDGVIIIDDADVSVWANQASLLGSSVNHLSVETWLNNSNEIMLSVDGSLQGPAADGLSVLNDSPLTTIVGTAFAGWNLSGDLSTDLQLQMNLTNKLLAPTVEVATHWRDVDLDIVPGNLSVGRLNGVFNYSTEQGFSSQDLTGAIWGAPLKIALVQQHLASGDGYEAGSSVVDVVVGTQVNMDDVRQWLNLPSLAFVQGKTTADIKIRIAPGEAPVLKVDSALLGVSLDLPEPWDKSSETETAMHLEMPLVGNGNLLSITLGEHLNMRLNVVDGVLRSGALSVDQEPAALDDGVLRINGHAPLVQADEWIRFVSNYFVADPTVQNVDISATRETGEPLAIIIDQVQADSLVLWGQEFSDVLFSLAIEPDLWRLAFDTSWLQGTMLLAQDDGVSQLDIARLDLSGLEQLNLALGDSQQVLELPDIDVTVNSLYQGDSQLGSLSFELRSDAEVLTASNIIGDLASMNLRTEHPGQLVWRQGSDSTTELQASFYFEDLGQTLEYYGYQQILETRQGRFDFDLSWPGAPQDFSLLEGEGSMDINIGSGSFLEAPAGATGALRVVSILNLADIVRRLSLTHMFESGIPFDSVKGEVLLDRGTIDVERMEVKGGSSFAFSGVSQVGTKSLDGELIATLPVAKNLPWVAALAASLPIAAGVYVVSKVFKTQMNRLSSAVYSIGGTWNDPLVEFDHIFDGSTDKDTNGAVNKTADNAANNVTGSTSNNAAGGNTGNAATSAAENPALEDATLIAPDPQSMPQSVPEPVSP